MIIQSERIWYNNHFIKGQIEIIDNKIRAIYSYNDKHIDIDYGNRMILPGFIDIHTHGGYGYDVNNGDSDGLYMFAKKLLKEGVTSFLPTIVSTSDVVMYKVFDSVYDIKDSNDVANIIGIHLEGPYINPKYKGAHLEKHLLKPNIMHFKKLESKARELVKLVTIAPELDENMALIKYLSDKGIIVSLGHSDADYDTTIKAINAGAKSFTHAFNGSRPLHHRDEGIINALLENDNTYAEIISDGKHLAPSIIKTLFKVKGKDYTIMVTDALNLKGLPLGTRTLFADQEVELSSDNVIRLVGKDKLAGSSLKMNEGLKLLIQKASIPWEYAINSCTINPARLLGIDSSKGLINQGYDADLVVLEDNFEVFQTYLNGIARL